MSNKGDKILIGIPTFDQNIHASLAGQIVFWTSNHELGLCPALGIQPVDEARNWLVERFLETDCTHLFFIDADTIPPPEALDKLLALNTPFASGLTPIINGQNHSIRRYNAVDRNDKEILPNTGVHQSRGVGASCLLIKREVFEKVQKPWFRFLHQDDTGKAITISEDIYFISKCLPLGITPVVDSSVVCNHIKKSIY